MADYFTLDPYYERYELGIAKLEAKTVAGRPDDAPHFFVIGCIVIGILGGLWLGYSTARDRWSEAIVWTIPTSCLITFLIYALPVIIWVGTLNTDKFERLRDKGLLLDGTLLSFEIVHPIIEYRWIFQDRRTEQTPYAKVIYQFTTPDNQVLRGDQRRLLRTDWTRSIPPHGTPIRVLYADPETYVML